MIQSGVFERFPDLALVGTEVQTGWIPYYLERFDDSVLRNRLEWKLPLLPSEYFRRNVSVVYIVDEIGAHNRYDIGVANMMWGPDFPHSSSAWPVDYELGREVLERGCTAPRARSSGSCGRTRQSCTRSPTTAPSTVGAVA